MKTKLKKQMKTNTPEETPKAKLCCKCNEPIHPGRLLAMPTATTCVACSSTGKVKGHALITGKTEYSAIQIVTAEQSDELSKLQNRIGYGISEGVRFDADKHNNDKPF